MRARGRTKRTLLIALVIVSLLCSSMTTVTVQATGVFTDVSPTHWAYDYIMQLTELKVTDGIGHNRFGIGQTVTRGEFVTFLCRLQKWSTVTPTTGHFSDVPTSDWTFPYVETALQQGVITTEQGAFRPNQPITRGDMAVMLVRTLGYDTLANQIKSNAFADVTTNSGYITIARDLGIVTGITPTQFSPNQTATREQAAAMMVRLSNVDKTKIEFINGFYAIRSSAQANVISSLDAVSFGWSRLETDGQTVKLNTTSGGGNEYNLPSGYQAPFDAAQGKTRMLLVAVKDADAVKIINTPTLSKAAAELLGAASDAVLPHGSFDGLVVDFETLKGTQSRQNYTTFLTSLQKLLKAQNKLLYVAVHPGRTGLTYYDGYDYQVIGELADKVILMAHDYNAKTLTQAEMASGIVMTPVAPIADVYDALSIITNKDTGVVDRSKIVLQLSFATAQWKMKNGKVINATPYTPDYEAVVTRMKSGAALKYSAKDESPYITFYSAEDQTENVLWYEDSRSLAAKIQLATRFGITNASLWRIGTIPEYSADFNLDVLPTVLSYK